MSLVLHHDEGAVLRAIELALEAGVPTKAHIRNLQHRVIDPKQTDHPAIYPPPSRALLRNTILGSGVARYFEVQLPLEKNGRVISTAVDPDGCNLQNADQSD